MGKKLEQQIKDALIQADIIFRRYEMATIEDRPESQLEIVGHVKAVTQIANLATKKLVNAGTKKKPATIRSVSAYRALLQIVQAVVVLSEESRLITKPPAAKKTKV